jgi:hypothetical protein
MKLVTNKKYISLSKWRISRTNGTKNDRYVSFISFITIFEFKQKYSFFQVLRQGEEIVELYAIIEGGSKKKAIDNALSVKSFF